MCGRPHQHRDDTLYIEASFAFARGLTHELAHCAVLLTRGSQTDFYFPGCAISEDGFQWEGSTYGGLLNTTRTSMYKDEEIGRTPEVRLTPCPVPQRVKHYVAKNYTFGVRLSHGAAILPCPGEELLKEDMNCETTIDFAFLRKLFTNFFWDMEVPTVGAAALKPYARYGYWQRWERPNLPDMISVLSGMYTKGKRALEDKALMTDSPDELEELKKACEPWDKILSAWASKPW